ncbi:MAG: hypothetical protein J4473_05330 [Candidatus Aenigmarchaeota archaeon]|nr:hypothetical protein [Candidatus Aenigmarchaeota archaeon]
MTSGFNYELLVNDLTAERGYLERAERLCRLAKKERILREQELGIPEWMRGSVPAYVRKISANP